MRKGGNTLINKLFEGTLSAKQKVVVKPNEHTELDPRSNFIYDKYQHRKWFDLKAAKDKSIFQIQNGKRVSNGAFDDFLALRTKDAASDGWHGGNEVDNSAPLLRKQNAPVEPSRSLLAKKSSFESELQEVQSAVRPKSLRRGQPDPRVDILKSTLQRMDSKREILQVIRGFEKEDADQNISPRKIKQSSRRMKDSNVSSDRRRGGESSTDRPRTRRGASGDNESRGGEAHRSKSASSNSSGAQDSRPGAWRHASDQPSSSSRKSTSKPDVNRSSAKNTVLDARSEGNTAARNPGPGTSNKQSHVSAGPKSPGSLSRSRGVSRALSMGNNRDGEQGSNRRRSKSTKRYVRRAHSSEIGAIFADGDASTVGFDGNASQVSTRSARRTTRVRRDSDDTEDEEISRSSTIRRSRREETSRPRSVKKDPRSAPNSRSRSRPRKAISSSTNQ